MVVKTFFFQCVLKSGRIYPRYPEYEANGNNRSKENCIIPVDVTVNIRGTVLYVFYNDAAFTGF